MRGKSVVVGFISGVLLTIAYFSISAERSAKPRPRVFVGREQWSQGSHLYIPESDHAKDIWQICPQIELIFDYDEAQTDYGLWTTWTDNRWNAVLLRYDSAYLMDENSRDFNQVLRQACAAIQKDTNRPFPPRQPVHTSGLSESRYELHDLHNGPVSTSAMIDKKTGKVWVWRSNTDQSGKTKSAFVSEEIDPEPESK